MRQGHEKNYGLDGGVGWVWGWAERTRKEETGVDENL